MKLSGAGARFWLAITLAGAFASGPLDAGALMGAGLDEVPPDAALLEEAALTDGALLDDAALEESAALETGAGAVEAAGAEAAVGAAGTAGSGVLESAELAAATAVPEDSTARLPEADVAATVFVEGNPESTKPALVGSPAADDISVLALVTGLAGAFTATL